jgi:hypothetical protein
MNSTNPNSTLTSSTSNQHLRLTLQALPYAPDEGGSSNSPQKKKGIKRDKEKSKEKQRRGHVEHFVPAIWVPDSKADSCMRCGGVFGWRRRRHHCRLCGNCVCANCSGKVSSPSRSIYTLGLITVRRRSSSRQRIRRRLRQNRHEHAILAMKLCFLSLTRRVQKTS